MVSLSLETKTRAHDDAFESSSGALCSRYEERWMCIDRFIGSDFCLFIGIVVAAKTDDSDDGSLKIIEPTST